MTDKRFIKGLELFNEGEYFESHEAIEDLWLETPSDDKYRDLYKGVIQAAAAIYQFQRGILTGAEGLYKTSVGYLAKYTPTALGLNVQKLIDDMHHWKLNRNMIPVLEYESRGHDKKIVSP